MWVIEHSRIAVIEPKRCNVLDTPLSRGMTAHSVIPTGTSPLRICYLPAHRAGLTFAILLPRFRHANVKSSLHEHCNRQWFFDFNIRKSSRREGMRMLESDHRSS